MGKQWGQPEGVKKDATAAANEGGAATAEKLAAQSVVRRDEQGRVIDVRTSLAGDDGATSAPSPAPAAASKAKK